MEYQLRDSILPVNEDMSLIERIFAARGIESEDINKYINTTDDVIINPNTIANIKDGILMLAKHIAARDPIHFIVDCDVDGYTSSALLINYLNKFFPSYVQDCISYRIHDGKQHGIEDQFIIDIISKGYKMVVCPDSSSNNYEQHKILHDHGIDVLVIDHHEADKISEDACVINNQLCDYPTKSLSGVGMVYKFCCEMDSLYDRHDADDFLDLVSIGMVADMMSLRDLETKHLIFKGFQNIRNPFIKEIVRTQGFSINRAGGLSPFSVSFYIAPLVNATIRMGTQEEKNLLFESMLDFKGYSEILSTKRGYKGKYETVVEQACRNCSNIKNRQTKAKDASLETIKNIIERDELYKNKIITVLLPNKLNMDRNITGLIANNLMAEFQHPILLLHESYTLDGEKCWEGSGRGYVTANFQDLRQFLKDSGYVFLAEGHSNALGVGIMDKDIDAFIKYSNEKLKDCSFAPCYKVDAICNVNDVKPSEIIEVAGYNTLWGQDMEQPMIAFEKVPITQTSLELMSRDKNPTLKITMPNGLSFIKFKSSEEEYDSLFPKSVYEGVFVNIVGVCNINEWNGRISPQIEVKDLGLAKTEYLF